MLTLSLSKLDMISAKLRSNDLNYSGDIPLYYYPVLANYALANKKSYTFLVFLKPLLSDHLISF